MSLLKKLNKSSNPKVVFPVDKKEILEGDLVHYTNDSALNKCAVTLMDFIFARTEANLYTTNQHLDSIPGYGKQAKSNAKKLLEATNYVTFDLLPRHVKGWRAIRDSRPSSEIPDKELSPYAHLPNENTCGGFTYVFKKIRDGIYKIGSTENLRTRAPAIACGCGSHLCLVIAIDIPEYQTIEAELHECFDHKRTVGEWFELDEKDLDKIQRFFLELETGGF